MTDFNIQIPQEVITKEKHDAIDFTLLENKVIIGLAGYAKSGKDFIAKKFIDDYGYKRVAFADNIKIEMNTYLKEAVLEDLKRREREEYSKRNEETGMATLVSKWTLDKIDFFSEDSQIKPFLRPYVIWYGEKMRNINGRFCWINRAFAEDAKDIYKIVLSDVRRVAELDIFRDSNEYNKRQIASLTEAGLYESINFPIKNYSTLLFEVSQLGLRDGDALTTETLQLAHEDWLIDHTFTVNPNISDVGNHRERAMNAQLKKVIAKFGIEKPEKLKYEQSNIFSIVGDSISKKE